MRRVWSTTSDVLSRVALDARLQRLVESRSVSHDVVRRYVAGESIPAALDVTGELLARGRLVSLTYLGAEPLDAAQAKDRRRRLRKVVRRAAQAGYTSGGRCEVSVRLGTLGARLPSGPEAAYEHARLVCAQAAEAGTRVVLETENDVPVDVTLAVAGRLRAEFGDVGVAVQAGLRRTETDLPDLLERGMRVRLARGTATRGAYERPQEVDLAYVRCLRLLLASKVPGVVAAPHLRLLRIAEELARREGSTEHEYQLRYGVGRRTQTTIADRGDRMRVYVPFGEDWYPYLVTRIAEERNPIASLLRAATTR